MKNKYISLIVGAGIVASLAVVLPVFAQTQPGGSNGFGDGGRFGIGMRGSSATPSGIFGTVASVSGDTLTVTARTRPNASSTPSVPATVYTVDATNAKVVKNGATSTIASVNVGDMVMVQGTVSGTNVAAKMIRDGMNGMMGRPGTFASSTRGMQGNAGNAFGRRPTSTKPVSGTPPFQGNGEPVVVGSISAMSGSMLTVANASNVTYTIDASSATFVKGRATSTIASVAVGDNVVVQGTVNGTSVTASSVIDQGTSGNGKPTSTPPVGPKVNIFGAIGNFFKHIFGF
jgi:hypothetical protein